MKQDALDFIKKHAECVLASVSPDGVPEAATVLFAAEDDFTLYFGTEKKYRKYANLLANNKAAVVVGVNAKEPKTVQVQGEMEFFGGPEDIEYAKKLFTERNPAMVPFFKYDLVFMRLKPTWLRYLDETKGGSENFEQIIG